MGFLNETENFHFCLNRFSRRIKDQELEINQLKAENEMLRKQARLPSGVPQLPAKGMNVRAVSGKHSVFTIFIILPLVSEELIQ